MSSSESVVPPLLRMQAFDYPCHVVIEAEYGVYHQRNEPRHGDDREGEGMVNRA
jgi:hypothetical protein